MRKSIFALLLTAFAIGGCSDATKSKSPEKKEEKAEIEKRFKPNKDHLTQPRLNEMDSIKYVIAEWNRALNESDFGTLKSLYTDNVFSFYGTASRDNLISEKKERVQESPEFSQRISLKWVQLSAKSSPGAVCYLLRQTDTDIDDLYKETVLIELIKVNGEYKISKEVSDYDFAETLPENEEIELPLGKTIYSFSPIQTDLDDREGSNYFMPPYARIEVDYDGKNVSVVFNRYTDEYDEIRENVTRNARFLNGRLILETSEYFKGEDIFPDEDEYYTNEYFIFEDHIALMKTDDIEWEGCRFWINE